MKSATPTIGLLREAALVAVGNSFIALFLTAITEHDFTSNFIYSQCIGLSIYASIMGLCRARRRTRPGLAEALAGIPLGGMIGFALGTWANGLSLAMMLGGHPRALVMSAASALLFGGVASYFFYSRARLVDAEAEARTEKLRRLEQEALTAQTELRLLQAQIEPHFLFNTLSNIVGLVDADPAAAKNMLLDLTALLRTALARTRRSAVALSEELDLLRAYLGIMAIRMGPRLQWRIEADADTLDAQLPPLLVQPLVENAIRHGLEPRHEGGSLTIRCRRAGDDIEIAVEDSGRGFAESQGGGVGLANVRERLRACCGESARLALETSPAGGVSARLTLPYANHAPADR
jgi:signal transduction histidine kinase